VDIFGFWLDNISMIVKIPNHNNELLDASIDGADLGSAKEILVYNHGFGTDKHERGLTDDIVNKLIPERNDICVLRFSYAGYGQSEGKQEEKTLDTMANDLVAVWEYVDKSRQKDARIVTISFSMGNQVLTKALAKYDFKIDKLICVSPANFVTGEDGKEKWSARPGVTFAGEIMNIPRADGSITKISQSFWDSLGPVQYKVGLTKVAESHDSVLIRGLEDNIVENSALATLPFKQIYEIHGDHNFSGAKDREIFLDTLIGALS